MRTITGFLSYPIKTGSTQIGRSRLSRGSSLVGATGPMPGGGVVADNQIETESAEMLSGLSSNRRTGKYCS
jgi:hypothetical protein